MNYRIKRSIKKNCYDIPRIVTKAWNETYRNIVYNELLDNLYKN